MLSTLNALIVYFLWKQNIGRDLLRSILSKYFLQSLIDQPTKVDWDKGELPEIGEFCVKQ